MASIANPNTGATKHWCAQPVGNIRAPTFNLRYHGKAWAGTACATDRAAPVAQIISVWRYWQALAATGSMRTQNRHNNSRNNRAYHLRNQCVWATPERHASQQLCGSAEALGLNTGYADERHAA